MPEAVESAEFASNTNKPVNISRMNANKIMAVNNALENKRFITSSRLYEEDIYSWELEDVGDDSIEIPPINTPYQLKIDQITHAYLNDAIPIALPANETTPEQMKNIELPLGLSRETMSMQGVLVDRGAPRADNLTKHAYLNIARQQWSYIIQDAANPLSYPRLTLNAPVVSNPNSFSRFGEVHQQVLGVTYNIDGTTEVDTDNVNGKYIHGFPRYFRGLISNLTFTLMGGRPDIWNWRMEFTIIKNENFWLRPGNE